MQQVFYSRTAGLAFQPPELKGKIIDTPSGKARVDEKIVQFTPMGNTAWGMCSTSDPEIIAVLDKRRIETGDVMNQAEYLEASMSPDQKIAALKREVTSANRLLDILKQQGKITKDTGTLTDALGQVEAKAGASSSK